MRALQTRFSLPRSSLPNPPFSGDRQGLNVVLKNVFQEIFCVFAAGTLCRATTNMVLTQGELNDGGGNPMHRPLPAGRHFQSEPAQQDYIRCARVGVWCFEHAKTPNGKRLPLHRERWEAAREVRQHRLAHLSQQLPFLAGRDRRSNEDPAGAHAARFRLWSGDAGVEAGSERDSRHDGAEAFEGFGVT